MNSTELRQKLKLLRERSVHQLRRAQEYAVAHARRFAEHAGPKLRQFAENAKFLDRVKKILPSDLAKSMPTQWDAFAIGEWLTRAFQRQGAGLLGTAATIVTCSLILSGVFGLVIEKYIPEPPAAARLSGLQSESYTPVHQLDNYKRIFERNLLSSSGLIPGEDSQVSPSEDTGAPQKTTLPLTLIGTMIFRNEFRSIATIEDKSASQVFPVRVEDEIPSKIRILKIESRKVTFLNISSGRREFVDLPEDLQVSNARVSLGRSSGKTPTSGVETTAANTFNVAKTEIDRAFTDLNSVLTQARAVPHYENGVPAGYKLFQVMPEGFFGKLGLKDHDVICGIDNQPVNDPAKALELLGTLKTANHVELCVKREGRQQTFGYDIR